MMNIREYIESLDEEERDEIAYTMYQISQDDPLDFECYCIENGIDLTATEMVGREEIPVVVLWGWDMCGD